MMHKAFREEGAGDGAGEGGREGGARDAFGSCHVESYSSGLGEGKEDSLCKNDKVF